MGFVDKNKKAPKGLVDICILDIIREATRNDPVTQEQIRERLKDDYGIEIDRKSMRRHLSSLVEGIKGIEYTEKRRSMRGKDSSMLTDFWFDYKKQLDDQEFSDIELRALIYTVIFAKHIPVTYKRGIVKKLGLLASDDLRKTMCNYIFQNDNTESDFNELFLSMEIVLEALDEKKKIMFDYTHYVVDQKKPQAMEQRYTVSPLGIGVRDDDFYLIATVNGIQNDDPRRMAEHFKSVLAAMEAKEGRIDTFRMDRIKNAGVLDEQREEIDSKKSLRLKGARWNRLDVQEYIRENPTLASGHTVRAKFRLTEGERCTISDAIDHFGKGNVHVQCENPNAAWREPKSYLVSLRVNDGALRDFALRNTPDVEVLKPESLRDEIREAYEKALGSL